MIKVTKYNKVYAVSEQEIEKQIYIFLNELKMNEKGEYTGLVAGEAVTQEDIDKEISKLKDRIEKLKAHDNDLIASLFVWTKEDAEFDDYYNALEASGDQPMLQTFLAYYAKGKIEISEFASEILKEMDLYNESDSLETMIIKIAWNIADANDKTMDFVHSKK